MNKNKELAKVEKKLQKLKLQGWKPDTYYTCKTAFAKERRVVHLLTHRDELFCSYCDTYVTNVSGHCYTDCVNHKQKTA